MGINRVQPTTTQTTRKTIRGMVTKNLLALLLVGHPLGLIENVIHTGVDWVVNNHFCTTNKLVNVGIHLASCLSIDGLIHGTGHEIIENFTGDIGHTHDVFADNNVIDDSLVDTTIQEEIVEEEVVNPDVATLSQQGGIWGRLQQMHDQTHHVGDGHDHGQHLVGHHDDTGSHHEHGGGEGGVHHHEHDHEGHGLLPILGGAVIEEYGPGRVKVVKQQHWYEDLFNLASRTEKISIKTS